MSIRTGSQERASAARLIYLLEAHTPVTIPVGEANELGEDRAGATKTLNVGAAGQRSTDDALTRRSACERSALRAEFRALSSNCTPS